MSDSSDAKRAIRNAKQSGPSGPDWTPMSAAEFAAELTRSQPHYIVKELLGHGGMGAVYLAEDLRVSPPSRVAIKMLRPDALDDKTFLGRFDREIESLRKLDHRNVVRIFDASETCDGYRFFVMELLEGQTLASVLAEPARMPLQRVMRIMADICAGVEQVHEEGLVHRDLKAANVFIADSDGRAVILDFGVVRDLKAVPGTRPGTQGVVGTEGYIAPEVRQGQKATPVSDVFSLGVIFFQMLTGEIPDVGHQPPSDFGLDPRLDSLTNKAISQKPEDRYRSAKDFAEAIKAAVEPIRTYARHVEPMPPPPSREPPRANIKPAEPPMSERMEVQFADASSVERHQAFFRAYAREELEVLSRVAPRVGEEWRITAEWNASHDVSTRRGGKKINPPALVAWSPDGKRLFTAADAWGLKVWEQGYLMRDYRLLGQDVTGWGYGNPGSFFIARSGHHYRVLQETQTHNLHYYLLHDGDARKIVQGCSSDLWGYCSTIFLHPPLSVNANMGFNPWRPGSEFEIAIVENYSKLKIVNVTGLEEGEVTSRGLSVPESENWLIRMIALFSSPPPSRPRPLHDAPAVHVLDFSSLGARDKYIYGFQWHPSGEYLSVNSGDWEDKTKSRVHIAHVRSAQIIASIPATATSLKWSPGGRYLLIKRWVQSSDGKLVTEEGIWDGALFKTRFGELDLIFSQPWAMHGLHSAPQRPDESYIYDKPDTALSMDGQRMLAEHGSVVTSVKREGWSIRPGEVLSRIAGGSFAHAAWSPTDPHCFVTVGGEGSKDFPDVYKNFDQSAPHGQLLRMWQLTMP